MRFKSKNTLKFKITFLVLSILILICGMLTYTSIYKNKGETNIAIRKLENSATAIVEDIEKINIYTPEEVMESNGISNNDKNQNELIAKVTPSNAVKIRMEPIHTALVDSQANFKNMQITFMIIMVVLGSIITYIILSKLKLLFL